VRVKREDTSMPMATFAPVVAAAARGGHPLHGRIFAAGRLSTGITPWHAWAMLERSGQGGILT
jgi:hypothetical protein